MAGLSRITRLFWHHIMPLYSVMETYMTEMAANHRYSGKVVQHDGKVLASADSLTLGMAHQWIDERPKAARCIDRTTPGLHHMRS